MVDHGDGTGLKGVAAGAYAGLLALGSAGGRGGDGPVAPVVAQGVGEVVLIAVAADGAGVDGHAALGAGRRNDIGLVVVVDHGDGTGLNGVAAEALADLLALGSAGGLGGNDPLAEVVAQRLHGLGLALRAAGAFAGLLAGLGAGGRGGDGPFTPVMAQRIGLVLDPLLVGDQTGVGGEAALGAGGRGDHAGRGPQVGTGGNLEVVFHAVDVVDDVVVLPGVVDQIQVAGLRLTVAVQDHGVVGGQVDLQHIPGMIALVHAFGAQGFAGPALIELVAGLIVPDPGVQGVAVQLVHNVDGDDVRLVHGEGDYGVVFLDGQLLVPLSRVNSDLGADVLGAGEAQNSQIGPGGRVGVGQGDDAALVMDGDEGEIGGIAGVGQNRGIVGHGDDAVVNLLGLGQGDVHIAVLLPAGALLGGADGDGGTDRVGAAGDGVDRRVLLRLGGGEAGHDLGGHQLLAADVQALKLELLGRPVQLGGLLRSGGRDGAVGVETGGGPDAVAEVAGAVELPVGSVVGIGQDHQLGDVAVLTGPVEVGAIVVDGVVLQAGGDAGVVDQGRAAEADAGALAVGHVGLPDLAGLIQEVVTGGAGGPGGGAAVSDADRHGIGFADVGLGQIQQAVGEAAVGAQLLVSLGLQVAEDQVGGEGIHIVAGAEVGGNRGHAEGHHVVLAQLGQRIAAAIDRVDKGTAQVVGGGIEGGGAGHEGAGQIGAAGVVVALCPGGQVVGVEVGEVDVALLVPDHSAQLLVDGCHVDRAFAELGAVGVGGGADRGGAGRNGGHVAGLVHGGDVAVAGGPGDGAVRSGQRGHLGGQVGGSAAVEIQGGRSDRNAADTVGIDLIGDGGLDVEVHLIGGRGVETEGVVVVAQIAGAVGQTVVGAVIGPVAVGGAGVDGQAIVIAAAHIPCFGTVDVGKGNAGGSGPDAGLGGVGSLDVGLAVGFGAARLYVRGEDKHVRRGGVGACGRRVGKAMARAGGVAVNYEIILARGQGIGQNVHGLFDVGVVVDLDGHGGLVAGVVAREAGHVAVGVGDGVGGVKADGVGRGAGSGLGVLHAAVQGQDRHIGQGPVVGGGDGQSAAVQAGVGHNGGGVVHHEVVAHEGALAQHVVGQGLVEARQIQHAGVLGVIAVVDQHAVVLGDGVEAHAEQLALRQTVEGRGLVDGLELRHGVHPGGLVHVVVLADDPVAGDGGGKDLGVLVVLVQPGHGEAGGAGGADQVIGDPQHGGIAVDGQTVGGELAFHHVGVAGELDVGAAEVQRQVVGVGVAGVGQALGAVELLGVGHVVKHGGLGPVAVEAQDGDGVLEDFLVLGGAGQVGEAFQIGAVDIVVQHGLLRSGEPDRHNDLGHAAGGKDVAVLGFLGLPVDEQVGVAGGDLAVLVQIGHGQIHVLGAQLAAQVVQNGLHVQVVGVAVLVHVVALGLGTVGGPGVAHAACGQQGGAVGQELALDLLGEEVGIQLVAQILVAQVVELEAEAVAAGLLGIVAQLGLDLAVGIGAGADGQSVALVGHHDHGGGLDGLGHIGQTGALLQDGEILILRGHGGGGGHQQALENGAGVVVGGQGGVAVGNGVLPQVLRQHAGQARNVGRGHGGAGEGLISGVGAAAVRVGLAVDGVDVAAGGGDLGLHQQGAGNAPGGEVGDDGLGAVDDHRFLGVGDLHAAGVVGDAVGLVGGAAGLDPVGVLQGDGDHGEAAGEVGQVHVDGAVGVVGDGHAPGVVGLGVVALLGEGELAAVDQDDLAAEGDGGVDRGVVRGIADGVDVDVVIAARDGADLRVGVGVAVGVGGGLGVEHLLAAVEDQGHALGEGVVGGGDAEAVDKAAGAAAGVVVDVVAVDVPGVGGHGEIVGVAGGDGDQQALVVGLVGQAVQDVLIAVVKGPAGGGGAQRQVGRVAVQDDGVLEGGHVVGVRGAAACAEDLHDQQLGVGSHAHSAHGLGGVSVAAADVAVGGGDAGHVGAVVARAVRVVNAGAAVHVVVAVGDLGVDVVAGSGVELTGEGLHLGLGQQLGGGAGLVDGIGEGLGGHGLVAGVQAGVDDGDAGARAGVAHGPGFPGADHVLTGVDGVGVVLAGGDDGGLVEVLDDDLLDAGDRPDGLDVAEADVGGDHVGRQGQVPLDLQLSAGGLLDLDLHGVLGLAQALSVGQGGVVPGHVLHGVAVQGGSALQLDGDAEHIRCRIGLLLRGGSSFVGLAQLVHMQLGGIHFGHFQSVGVACLLLRGRGNRGNQQRDQHCDRQQNRKQPAGKGLVLHTDSPFL